MILLIATMSSPPLRVSEPGHLSLNLRKIFPLLSVFLHRAQKARTFDLLGPKVVHFFIQISFLLRCDGHTALNPCVELPSSTTRLS